MSELLFNRELLQDIMLTGVRILRDNFCYTYDTAQMFGDAFVTNMNKEHMYYVMNWSDEHKLFIHEWEGAKDKFTTYVAGLQLFDTLTANMNFSNEELKQFQNIFTKYVKVVEPHEFTENERRAND